MKPIVLTNKTRVHLVPFSGTQAVTVLVLFRVGSRNEALPVWGGSHFVEHLMFKGTTRRPKTLDISRILDQYGAEYNAYTGKDVTGYYVKIDAAQAATAVDLLHDMLFHSKFDATEMTREKKVIIEEIKMYEENPLMHLEDLLEEAMFDGHTLGRNIAGTAKSMMDMKRADVLAYRDHFYRPENMVVVLAGKVPVNTRGLIEKTFGRVKGQTSTSAPRVVGPSLPAVEAAFEPRKTMRVRIQNKPVEQIPLAFGFPTVGRGHKDSEAIKLLASILGGTMSSRLFVEVRERRGLCYSIRAASDAYDEVGTFQIRAGLDRARLALASKVIWSEIQKVVRAGVTARELAMAKDHVRGATTLSLEDSSDRAEFYGRQELFLGSVKSPEEKLKAFDRVTRADVHRVARAIFVKSRMSVSAIGPFESEKAFLKLLAL